MLSAASDTGKLVMVAFDATLALTGGIISLDTMLQGADVVLDSSIAAVARSVDVNSGLH